MSINLTEFKSQVKENCNISDSQYWGYLSLCNMLLRLRELYFHEHGIRPWDKVQKEEVGNWITARESLWEQLEEEDLKKIVIGEREFQPFDLEGINSQLEPLGLIYGGGYGVLKKPNFFLGQLNRKEKLLHLDVFYVENEICRDLTPHVAMHQNGSIYIRLDVFENYLYQKFMELKKEFHADVLKKGFEFYEIDIHQHLENPAEKFKYLARELTPILLWHELGEAKEAPGEDQPVWLEMLAKSDNKLTEIRLRAIKDVLADNSDSGTLYNIIKKKDKGPLYFHLSLIDESRKHVFPDIHHALEDFEKSGDWEILEISRVTLRNRTKAIRDELLELYKEKRDIQLISEYLKNLFQ